MKYKIADIVVDLETRFEVTKKRASKYKVEEDKKSEFEITVTDSQIKKVQEDQSIPDDFTSALEVEEYIIAGTNFYRNLLNKNGCMLHASAVVIDDEAYLFSANCGTGKSTHTSLWMKYLAEKKPYILNDDKPAIRVLEDGIFAYGTPFSGKHDINENKKVKLKAICFLEQAEKNEIAKVETAEAIKLFFEQTVSHLKKEELEKFLDILEKILEKIPIYKLRCNMSEEAVQLSYQTLKGDTNEG